MEVWRSNGSNRGRDREGEGKNVSSPSVYKERNKNREIIENWMEKTKGSKIIIGGD